MESHGLPGAIQVTERAYQQLRDRYDLHRRGTIEVKGKGPMTTYLLIGRRDASSAEPHFAWTAHNPLKPWRRSLAPIPSGPIANGLPRAHHRALSRE
jgi:hypothetical protein